MKTKKNNWTCTDPDNKQYGRQLSAKVFEFKEKGKSMIIDLDEYEIKEQEHTINSFGYTLVEGDNKNPSLENIKDLYGDDANWIIAECIFEEESN